MPAPATDHASAHRTFIDPRALMSIRNLELRARVVVEGFWSGIHRSPYHGFSVEFTEYRQYTPDDDPRYLDWRVYARSDRYFIKKFEDETNLRCFLLSDSSRSMGFGSLSYTKGQYAATLAATLGYFLYLQGDAVGFLSFDHQVREFLPARHRTGHLRQIMLALEKQPEGTDTDLSPALKRILEILRKRSMVLIVSDFLAPLDRLQAELLALTAAGHELMLFQVLDPAETQFAFDKAAMFEDVESGRTLYIEPTAVRGDYLRKLEAHCDQLRNLSERLGATFRKVNTDQPLELVLLDVLRARMVRRASARRFTRQAGAVRGGTT